MDMQISVGDSIEYVDGFGHGVIRRGRVVRIELVDHGQDTGARLDNVPLELLNEGFEAMRKGFMVTVDLGNKRFKWAYGSQVIGPVNELEGNA